MNIHTCRMACGAAALIVTGLALVIGAAVMPVFPQRGESTDAASPQRVANAAMSELDFGLVELTPERATPITSYKTGGTIVLYAGEELRFKVVGDAPLPPIELHAGDAVLGLAGIEGALQVTGPPRVPMLATMVAKGERVSLPGGAPPRVSVEVQVFGAPRQRHEPWRHGRNA